MAVAVCAACGATIVRPVSQLRGRIAFCGMRCRRALYRPQVTCAGCGNHFTRDPRQSKRRYCTWECFKSSRWVAATCATCGVEYRARLCEQQKRVLAGSVACCSRSCRNIYTSRLLGGDGTWMPKPGKRLRLLHPATWRKVRAAYLATIPPTCEGCGGARIEHVHHLHPVSLGGDPYSFDNLMAVCRPCHDNMHGQLMAGAFNCSLEAASAA